MRVVQLLASPFVGGPERQLLGLASHLLPDCRTVFLSFAERGLARAFLEEARRQDFEAVELTQNAPHLYAAAREVAGQLRCLGADVLCCNGYKPDLIGWLAARLAGVPVMAIAHGWTSATLKVKVYEALDRRLLRWLDAVVCVSAAQGEQVVRSGVPLERVRVIRNAIALDPVATDPLGRAALRRFFPQAPRLIVGAAGRLSPEKGFDALIRAAALCRESDPGIGFILFGDGPLRPVLARQIAALGLEGRFILAGFRADWRRFLPHLDLLAMSSTTEGLPVVLLEACSAAVPVVATAVGGIPEVIAEGVNGYLVPSGDAVRLAQRILDLSRSRELRQTMGRQGRERIEKEFSVAEQCKRYYELFEDLIRQRKRHGQSTDPATRPAAVGVADSLASCAQADLRSPGDFGSLSP